MKKRITIRIDETTYKQLKEEAKKKNITISEIIRNKINGRKYKITNKDNTKIKIIYEINKIGNNINQIAKYVNINKKIDKIVLRNLLDIQKKIIKIFEK